MSEIEDLKLIKKKYEENGPAKLYYALNRKAWEMADRLNSIDLKTVPLDDPKDKTFERMRFIINDSSGIATSIKAMGDIAGITGDEERDVQKSRRITTPESIAQELGDNKTQNV